ncbi:MAG: metallophosphoesterase [Acidimicrobiales bacterium]|nr:metallophosphoesterase [Acidimicrobiales bacterium]
MLRVTQLSDTHFSTDEGGSHGGMGYDTDETAGEVLAHAFGGAAPDLVVITGDVADHGRADEYHKAAAALEALPAPVLTWPGNHDFHVPFQAVLPRSGIAMQRTYRIGPWLFVFVDTNHDGREVAAGGALVDRPDRVEESNGRLGPAELAWVHSVIEHTDAAHVFLWVHHPPFMPGVFSQPAYDAEMSELLRSNDKVRGVAGGHVHTARVDVQFDRPVHVCPAFTVNIDLDEYQLLPPGYRTFEFGDDGTVASTAHLLDDPRWPRRAMTELGIRYLQGALSWDDLRGDR